MPSKFFTKCFNLWGFSGHRAAAGGGGDIFCAAPAPRCYKDRRFNLASNASMLAPPLSRDATTRPLNSLGLAKAPEATRVVVAMSGGVDSSVAAALLARQGYDVVGVTMQLYDHGAATHRKGACCAGQDIHDARDGDFFWATPFR